MTLQAAGSWKSKLEEPELPESVYDELSTNFIPKKQPNTVVYVPPSVAEQAGLAVYEKSRGKRYHLFCVRHKNL